MHNHTIKKAYFQSQYLFFQRMIKNIFDLQGRFLSDNIFSIDQSSEGMKKKKRRTKKSTKKVQLQKDLSLDIPIFKNKQSKDNLLNSQYNNFLQNQYFQNQHTYFGDYAFKDKNNQSTTQTQKVSKLISDIKKCANTKTMKKNIQNSKDSIALKQKLLAKKVKSNSKNQTYQFNLNYPQADEFGQNEQASKQLKKVGPYSNRKLSSRRIYMCGQCFCKYTFTEELLIHLNKVHKGVIPDGSIFGMKRNELLNLFHVPIAKPSAGPKKVYLFKCGCGKQYNCSSSLYYHVYHSHKGIQPTGTIGVLKRVKRMNDQQ